jgi:hypothetical protein
MSEPRYDDGRSPPGDQYVRGRADNTMAWTLGAISAVFVLGLILWSVADTRTASTPPAETTGQSQPAPSRK